MTSGAGIWVVAICTLVTACGGGIENDASTRPVGAPEHAARFVGDWDITFTTNRDSSASFALDATGSVQVLRRGMGTPLDAIAEKPGSRLSCGVGARWHSEGEATLILDGACTDGVARAIRVGFPEDSTRNTASDLRVVLVSVGSDTDWRITDVQGPWVLRRCRASGCDH